MNGEPLTFVLWGHELVVADLEDGWLVRYRDKAATARFLDHALAELLGLAPGTVLALVRLILHAEPGSEVFL